MKFDELDKKMRIYETVNDLYVLPGINIVARIDGRGFTKLTKEIYKFETPYDETFRNYMIKTIEHLMNCGFNTIYGYTQSDEISLLFNKNIDVFNRKIRKYNSILAGEASAKFSLLLGGLGAFDCRIIQLPSVNEVIDYFRWRHEDAHRNSLNGHCYLTLRKSGKTVKEVVTILNKMSIADKNELLFTNGVNFNNIPNWQKRGIGLYWEKIDKIGFNPKTREESKTKRNNLKIDMDLPMKDDYGLFIKNLWESQIN